MRFLKVMQRLLQEQVSIRNIVPILETLADYAPVSKDVSFLVEKSRQALGREICLRLADGDKNLRVLTLDPELEQEIIKLPGLIPPRVPWRPWIRRFSGAG